ncbi:heamagglutinin-neuraminidase [Orthorubulavirus simiae]|uniref:Hemagglutinin-neuraminidase n=1 Tax=Simian virus 41 TaxID=3052561 RepID=HN_SV41|nr:heamagglutinin-neuraminidase [Orthorubulavirus simiae]P25180.1 RecName: Full=Hemagglutinin-neuraminidase [Orthorubulavirus simiae]AAA47451.1 hemagglutinin-neuraminidase [Orthorubulavirus simiae]CAA45568.1 heamagglutinin-neuraminidase [Orthorubulavirus simiae]
MSGAEGNTNKRTFRAVFRTLIILITLTILALSAAILYEVTHTSNGSESNNQVFDPTDTLNAITGNIKSMIALLNQILYNAAIALPLKIDSTESVLLAAIKDLQFSNPASQNCSSGGNLLNDALYINGINQYLLSNSFAGTVGLGPLLNIPSFIPSATAPGGCTRIPSFSLTKTHWCYSHNVILAGCADSKASNQYLAMGIVEQSSADFPFFRTMRTLYLSDGINRKSCSIVAIPGGCALYCYVATKTEQEDYAATTPSELRLTFYYYNETLVERTLTIPNVTGNWATLNPAVGSGVYHLGYLAFPVYGGLIQNSAAWNSQFGSYFLPQNPAVQCSGSAEQQINTAKGSYVVNWFSGRLIQSAVLVCPLSDQLTDQCRVVLFNNSETMMGAEGRLYTIGGDLYYYQRSSSWWTASLLYKINTDFSQGLPPLIEAQWVPTYLVPRPGAQPCSAGNFCPANCITGVYADVWPMNNPFPAGSSGVNPNYLFGGAFLWADVARVNPTFYMASATQYKNTTGFPNSNQKAAYTSTTCFQNTGSKKIYCLFIIEMGSSLMGEFQIVPFLREVIIT